ncbi:MAG TPA: hypothetical protein VLX92_00705 [Kofleriaceae bacterium]|nr:hypothetical protein [Kofleriaceae bacterium]
MRWLGLVLACAACDAGAPARPAATAPPAAPPPPAAPIHGTLARGTSSPWPDRVCVRGRELVVENDCGCNDALLCRVDLVGASTIALAITLDPHRMPICLDCYPMVPGHCALPRLAPGPHVVTIGPSQAAFTLPIGKDGTAPDGSCWELGPR